MAVDGISPSLAIRSSTGVEIWNSKGIKTPFEPNPDFPKEAIKHCRAIALSSDGNFISYTNGSVVKILNTSDWKEISSLPRPKAFYIKFSPKGNYIVTWELFTTNKENPEPSPNLFVFKTETGKEVFSAIQKKQSDWEPCWSSDENIFALMIGGEAFFYDISSSNGFQKFAMKLGGGKNGTISIGPGNIPPFLAFYVPGIKGAPSMCKIYKYPALEQNQALTCKSFFQADNVEMIWNKRGSGLLLLTSTEVDQSGASYYGKQALHFMSTRGDSYAVQLNKEGPIHAVSWSPKGNEFCVVYGYMPAKATLYNFKCDLVLDFGEGSRNCCYFNDFGNFILAGFGNLRGYVEVWDMYKKEKISTFQAPDSTLLEWCPNGEILMTATTSPRLRMGNGFKVWHYCGALLHETNWPEGQELLDVQWQKFPDGTFKENPISNVQIEGIKSSQPQASKQVYKPPNVRLMQEGKIADIVNFEKPSIPGLPPGYKSQKQLAAKSNFKKKSRKLPKRDEKAVNDTEKSNEKIKENNTESSVNFENSKTKFTGPRDRQVQKINKKLSDISKLENKQKNGEVLDNNQLSKLQKKSALLIELKALKLNS